MSRRTLALEGGQHRRVLDCVSAAASVRSISVAPPADAAPGVGARHFVELFTWRRLHDPNGKRGYALAWSVYEVSDRGIGCRAMEVLRTSDTWPAPGLPAEFEEFPALQMIRSGHVRWTVAGAPPRRGWIMRPEEKRR